MKKVLGVLAFIFFVGLSVILFENYAVDHNDKVILVDTCINDSVQIVIDTLSVDSIIK